MSNSFISNATMQASKPLTPVKSKPSCKDTQQLDNLAQRVMEVTTIREKFPPAAKLVSTSGSDNNSIESSLNDHEVEAITSQASKIDLASSSSLASTNDMNEQKQNSAPLSSPLSVLSNNVISDCHRKPPTHQQQQHHQHLKQNFHMQQHHHLTAKLNGPLIGQACQVKGEQLESRNSALSVVEVSGSSVANHEQIISLDTKVPHPVSNFCNEEVSYYNESPATSANKTVIATATITNLLEPKQMGGSLDNNTKPRLLAAVASGQQHVHSLHHQQQEQMQNYQNHILQQQQQQQNHIRQQHASLMATSTSCLLRHNPYLNEDEQTGALVGCDDDELRYDNAEVERNLEAQRLNELKLNSNEEMAAGPSGCQRHKQVSISTSPKAKSAPATPCNVTPTAFHQVSTDSSSIMVKQNGNTLPPDIRKNISATCRVVPSSLNVDSRIVQSTGSRQDLDYLDKLRDGGERALLDKDFSRAIELLSQCIKLATQQHLGGYLEKNFKLYSHRAEAHLMLAKYNEAIEDSMAARDLNPKWTQAYYLQGKAEFLIEQYEKALAVFAFGLTHQDGNASSSLLFEAFVDAALTFSPHSFKPKFQKLKSLQLDTKQFVVVGLLGQELFSSGHIDQAAVVLESALKVSNLELVNEPATISQHKKFKSSLLSTISAVYCKKGDLNKAIDYMERELRVETELEDVAGQCRVLANLGYAYFKVRNFERSLETHRKQLNLALKLQMFQEASRALDALGHVHVARNNYSDALTSHSKCLSILKQLGDNYFNQFREILAIGHIHSQLGDFKAAETNYNEALQLLNNQNGLESDETTHSRILAEFNLAHLALKKQAYQEAEQYYSSVLQLAEMLSQSSVKRYLYRMRASNGMGHTFRLTKRFHKAKVCFEEQLQLANTVKHKLGQSQALCNLGMIQQHFKNYREATQFFGKNLELVKGNLELEAYAHSYLGSNYFLMSLYRESRCHYETSLSIFRKLDYREDECKTIEINLEFVKNRLLADGSKTIQSKKLIMTAS